MIKQIVKIGDKEASFCNLEQAMKKVKQLLLQNMTSNPECN